MPQFVGHAADVLGIEVGENLIEPTGMLLVLDSSLSIGEVARIQQFAVCCVANPGLIRR